MNYLTNANRLMGQHEEGIQQARKVSEIFERVGDTVNQARCLIDLAWLMHDDKQPDAAEEAASRALGLLPEKYEQSQVCDVHRVLGNVYHSMGKPEKAIHHLEVALGIASSLNTVDDLSWVHFVLAEVFFGRGMLDDARAHIERAKSHAANNAYNLAYASQLQVEFWDREHRFEEAKSEALGTLDVFKKLGATHDAEDARAPSVDRL